MTPKQLILALAAAVLLAGGGAAAGITAGSHSAPSAAKLLAAGQDGDYTGYCGVAFHQVKDLQDGFVPGTPIDSTISALTALPVDAKISDTSATSPRSPTEHNVYRVQATLYGTKGEGDSDIHLLLKDPATGATMGAEMPAAPCLADSADAPLMEAARASLIAAYGLPPTAGYSSLNACVDVTGVAFFDNPHGQADAAPNAIELHPVLAIQPCGSPPPPPPVTTGPQPPDTGPVTTTAPIVTTPTTTVVTTVTTPSTTVATTTSSEGYGCDRWPGRHYYNGRWHRDCRRWYFTTP